MTFHYGDDESGERGMSMYGTGLHLHQTSYWKALYFRLLYGYFSGDPNRQIHLIVRYGLKYDISLSTFAGLSDYNIADIFPKRGMRQLWINLYPDCEEEFSIFAMKGFGDVSVEELRLTHAVQTQVNEVLIKNKKLRKLDVYVLNDHFEISQQNVRELARLTHLRIRDDVEFENHSVEKTFFQTCTSQLLSFDRNIGPLEKFGNEQLHTLSLTSEFTQNGYSSRHVTEDFGAALRKIITTASYDEEQEDTNPKLDESAVSEMVSVMSKIRIKMDRDRSVILTQYLSPSLFPSLSTLHLTDFTEHYPFLILSLPSLHLRSLILSNIKVNPPTIKERPKYKQNHSIKSLRMEIGKHVSFIPKFLNLLKSVSVFSLHTIHQGTIPPQSMKATLLESMGRYTGPSLKSLQYPKFTLSKILPPSFCKKLRHFELLAPGSVLSPRFASENFEKLISLYITCANFTSVLPQFYGGSGKTLECFGTVWRLRPKHVTSLLVRLRSLRWVDCWGMSRQAREMLRYNVGSRDTFVGYRRRLDKTEDEESCEYWYNVKNENNYVQEPFVPLRKKESSKVVKSLEDVKNVKVKRILEKWSLIGPYGSVDDFEFWERYDKEREEYKNQSFSLEGGKMESVPDGWGASAHSKKVYVVLKKVFEGNNEDEELMKNFAEGCYFKGYENDWDRTEDVSGRVYSVVGFGEWFSTSFEDHFRGRSNYCEAFKSLELEYNNNKNEKEEEYDHNRLDGRGGNYGEAKRENVRILFFADYDDSCFEEKRLCNENSYGEIQNILFGEKFMKTGNGKNKMTKWVFLNVMMEVSGASNVSGCSFVKELCDGTFRVEERNREKDDSDNDEEEFGTFGGMETNGISKEERKYGAQGCVKNIGLSKSYLFPKL